MVWRTLNLIRYEFNKLFFSRKTLRMIPESDVGLAVVYASTEKYCNPSFPIGMGYFRNCLNFRVDKNQDFF